MVFFFSSINSYNFGKKAYISHFFSLFCSKIVIVIYFMLAIIIKNLALRWNNKKLAIEKCTI